MKFITAALALAPFVFGQTFNNGTNVNINTGVQVNVVVQCTNSAGCGVFPQGSLCDQSSVSGIPGFSQVCTSCSISQAQQKTTTVVVYQPTLIYICQAQGGCGPFSFGQTCPGSDIDSSIIGFVICTSCNQTDSAAISSSAVTAAIGFFICGNTKGCGIYPFNFVIAQAELVIIQSSCPGFIACTQCLVSTTNVVFIPNMFFVCALTNCGNFTFGSICFGAGCNLSIKGFVPCPDCTSTTQVLPSVPAFPQIATTTVIVPPPATQAVVPVQPACPVCPTVAVCPVCPTAAVCPPAVTVTVTAAPVVPATQIVVPTSAVAPVNNGAKPATAAAPVNNGAAPVNAAPVTAATQKAPIAQVNGAVKATGSMVALFAAALLL